MPWEVMGFSTKRMLTKSWRLPLDHGTSNTTNGYGIGASNEARNRSSEEREFHYDFVFVGGIPSDQRCSGFVQVEQPFYIYSIRNITLVWVDVGISTGSIDMSHQFHLQGDIYSRLHFLCGNLE